MNTVEVISLLASIASLILAVVAIGLSIIFFKMSSQLSEATTEAAKGIGASVDRLENLFDKLYSDTFSMMRDTVQDMRKHIWPADPSEEGKLTQEAEKKADEKIEDLKRSVYHDLSSVLASQKMTDDTVKGISTEVSKLIDRVIASSRQVDVEAKEETLRAQILRLIMRGSRGGVRSMSLDEIADSLQPVSSLHETLNELERMKEEGVLVFSDDRLSPQTRIRLSRDSTRVMRRSISQGTRTPEGNQGSNQPSSTTPAQA